MLANPLESRFVVATQIVRQRMLSVPGELTVNVGDKVQPQDVVAEAKLPGEVMALDVARLLNVSLKAAEKLLVVSTGARVERGAIVAKKGRLLLPARVVRTDQAGQVQGFTDGCLLIRQEPRDITLCAYLAGQVIERYPPSRGDNLGHWRAHPWHLGQWPN